MRMYHYIITLRDGTEVREMTGAVSIKPEVTRQHFYMDVRAKAIRETGLSSAAVTVFFAFGPDELD